MDRRVFVVFCLLTAVRSQDPPKQPVVTVEAKNMLLKCQDGTFDGKDSITMDYESSGLHTCKSEPCTDDTCLTQRVLVKVLDSGNLIELDLKALVSVLTCDILVTALIGWAVYTICAQPPTRSSYQGNKASDRQALINNHTPSGGDTYQRLNTRTDEYSTLHAQRKNKNKQSV